MVRQKLRAWVGARKRAYLTRKLKISDAQAAEFLSIVSFRRGTVRHTVAEDMDSLQSVLNEPVFEAQALETLVDQRLQSVRQKLEQKAQAFTVFVDDLDQAQRQALSRMISRHRCGRVRAFAA